MMDKIDKMPENQVSAIFALPIILCNQIRPLTKPAAEGTSGYNNDN